MSRLSHWAICTTLVFTVLAGAESYAEIPPAEKLLPDTTEGFLAVGSVDALKEAWNKTQLGQLMNDPVMQPFVESFQEQMTEKWTQSHMRLGITWRDLDGVSSGEVALALVRPSEKVVALAIVVDVAGRDDELSSLLAKINDSLTSQKAVRSERELAGTKITVYDIPEQNDNPARQVGYARKGDLLAASDNLKVLEGVIARQAGTKGNDLASLPAFDAINKRCRQAAGELEPQARWFIDPFGYAESVRVMETAERPRRKGTDMLKILQNQGFTAILGVGGFVNFAADDYEMLHRTFIYAPGEKSGAERFTLAARMLDLPNGGSFLPADWVPRDVASYAGVNLNTKNAFENSKTLVNEIVGDEVFEDVLESIRTDENGPMIDVRKELIALLGNRITIISDLQLPITPKSERMLFAVETNNPEQLAVTIQKQMETDEDARQRMINGHVVWEIVDEQSELPMVTIEHSPELGAGLTPVDEEPEEEEKKMLPNSAVTVAHGQLFVATHIDILAKVLSDQADRGVLHACSDFQRVEAEIAKLRLPEQSAQTFTRTDDAYRGVYELLRTGRMPEAESMLGRLLNSLLGEGKEGVLRTQQIDGSKLPEYDLVRRYLGPAGMTVTTEPDGWFLTGFTLTKEAESVEVEAKNADPMAVAPREETIEQADAGKSVE